MIIFPLVRKRKAAAGGGITDEANLTARWTGDSGVYSDAGVTLLSSVGDDGSTVQEWHSTHNSHVISQTTAAAKPTFQYSEQNSLPGIQFDGSDDFLALGSALLTAPPFTVYAVARTTDNTSGQTICMFCDLSVPDNYCALWIRGDQTNDPIAATSRDNTSNVSATTSTGITSGTTFQATGQEASATDRSSWINGGSVGTNTTSVTLSGIDQFAVGMMRDSSPSFPLTGFIFEIRVYGVAHDSTTRAAVESEMSTKWGV